MNNLGPWIINSPERKKMSMIEIKCFGDLFVLKMDGYVDIFY
jgi:hypothetical protein